MNVDTIYYHGTNKDDLNLNSFGCLFFSTDKRVAQDFGNHDKSKQQKIVEANLTIKNTFNIDNAEHVALLVEHISFLDKKVLDNAMIEHLKYHCSEKNLIYFTEKSYKQLEKMSLDKRLNFYFNLTADGEDWDLGTYYEFSNFVYHALSENFELACASLVNSEDSWIVLESKEFGLIPFIQTLGFDSFKTNERIHDGVNYNVGVFSLDNVVLR